MPVNAVLEFGLSRRVSLLAVVTARLLQALREKVRARHVTADSASFVDLARALEGRMLESVAHAERRC